LAYLELADHEWVQVPTGHCAAETERALAVCHKSQARRLPGIGGGSQVISINRQAMYNVGRYQLKGHPVAGVDRQDGRAVCKPPGFNAESAFYRFTGFGWDRDD
jgi:hypothetical protein